MKIYCKSRYGDVRLYKWISDNIIKVVPKGKSFYSRMGNTEDGQISFYDFEGGPFLGLDSNITIDKTDYTIVKITPNEKGAGVYLKLEDPLLVGENSKNSNIEKKLKDIKDQYDKT